MKDLLFSTLIEDFFMMMFRRYIQKTRGDFVCVLLFVVWIHSIFTVRVFKMPEKPVLLDHSFQHKEHLLLYTILAFLSLQLHLVSFHRSKRIDRHLQLDS